MSRTLDAVLVAAGHGDRRAFAAVYDALSPRAYGLALRILKDPDLAEAEVRDAFGEAWRLAGSFDPSSGSAAAWLLALVHRRVVATARTRPTPDALQDVARPLLRSAASGSTPSSAPAVSLRDATSPPHHEALELAYLDGLSLRDLSRRLDLQLAALAQVLVDGLRAITPTMGPAAGF